MESPPITASCQREEATKNLVGTWGLTDPPTGDKLVLGFAQRCSVPAQKMTSGSEHWPQMKGGQREEGKAEGSQGQAVHGEDRARQPALTQLLTVALLCTPALGDNPEPHELWSPPRNSRIWRCSQQFHMTPKGRNKLATTILGEPDDTQRVFSEGSRKLLLPWGQGHLDITPVSS